jgi:hypothetical protein
MAFRGMVTAEFHYIPRQRRTLMTEASGSSGTSVLIYQTTPRRNPEENNLNSHRCDNFRSQ